ncbi:MAG: glycosyltransferase family 4 protein [Thermoplasmata archaeon]
MRIILAGTGVHAIPPRGYGGIERTLDELGRALRAEGAEVTIVNEVRGERSLDEYRFAWGLPGRLRRVGGDVVHASTPAVANRLAFAGIPYVYTTHARHWFVRHGAREWFGHWLERRALAHASAAVALTERVRAAIALELGAAIPRRCPVIPIGVDLDRFRASPIPEGGSLLGVGVVARLKRWEIAAEAARGTRCKFILVGPQPDPAYARKLRSIGPHVELRGELPEAELRAAYAESALLLHPSSVELLPGVVLQALASGRPVLGGDPLAGLVRPGVTGYLAPEGASPREFVDFLRSRIEALRRDPGLLNRLGAEARRDAESRFSWSSVARAHLALYGELEAGPGTARSPVPR